MSRIIVLASIVFWTLSATQVRAAEHTYRNPVLPGGYPDPSVCRVGEDYYLVNSTFEYFPGLPVHHSKDLVNWTLIGHGLHDLDQVSSEVNLLDVQSDGGIHAPSIRCRDGRFYIITTNVYLPPGENQETQFVNFVLTADHPGGPWSSPHVIQGAPGIDPDLFFDDDGSVWYVGTHSPENPRFPGEGEIWLQQLDPETWSLLGPRHLLWRGACGGVWAEGPHLYKRSGRYYLMVAEGGTSFNHAVMVASSDRLTGPYESNPRNPILTSRHLSYDHWVNSTGHGDLVELADGRWYMVLLGIRGDVLRRSNMGRETHLVPIVWEQEPFWWKENKITWPVAAPATGRVERVLPVPIAGTRQAAPAIFQDDFDSPALDLAWNFRRPPDPRTYSLRDGKLELWASPTAIAERKRASVMGIRQTESDFEFTASMTVSPSVNGVESGIIVIQKDNNYLSMTLAREDDRHVLRATLVEPDQKGSSRASPPRILAQQALSHPATNLILSIRSKDDEYTLSFAAGTDDQLLLTMKATHLLSQRYTGAYLGLYATSNGSESDETAVFDWIRYQPHPRP